MALSTPPTLAALVGASATTSRQTLATTISRASLSSSSFFSSLLSPSLLSLSPLQSIVTFLDDGEKIKLCRVNREHHSILHRMRMNECHWLTTENWQLIDQRHGPIITSIQLDDLNELTSIPSAQLGQIKRVQFIAITSEEPIPRSSFPPLLEELITTNESGEECCRPYDDTSLRGSELPILPSTLKKLILGYRKEEVDDRGEDDVSPTKMMKRILSEVTNLTHLRMTVFEKELNEQDEEDGEDEEGDDENVFSVLPDTIETLELHMCTCEMPSETNWPKALKHLIIESDSEYVQENALDEIALPRSLVSIAFPIENSYDHYPTTLQVMSTMESLRTINFGSGIDCVRRDVFALLPRSLTQVTYCHVTALEKSRIDSLPDTIEVLEFPLNDLPVTRWPSSLRILHIFGGEFSQDLTSLPDSVESLRLPSKYIRQVSKWPKSLQKLDVGPNFFSLKSFEKLPQSIIELTVSLPIVRRMMSAGKFTNILPRLIRLILYGRPDAGSSPFDLRALPSTLTELQFDREVGEVLSREERPDIKVSSHTLNGCTKESDLESMVLIMNDEKMTSYEDNNDSEESIPFVTITGDDDEEDQDEEEKEVEEDEKMDEDDEEDASEKAPSQTLRVASKELFHLKTPLELINNEDKSEYELSTHSKSQQSISELIQRLTSATFSSPISGASLHGSMIPEMMNALVGALSRGAIVGPLVFNNCYVQSAFEGKRKKQKDEANGSSIDLPAAISYSKGITRLEIDGTSLHTSQLSPISTSTSSSSTHGVPSTFATLCRTIQQLPLLRVFVLRDCPMINSEMTQLLSQTLLSSECAHIEMVDLSRSPIGCDDTAAPIAQLVSETRTIAHLSLTWCELTISGIWQLAQAVVKNHSLLTLNLANNDYGLPGLHALRWSLHQNRMISIHVCHKNFGRAGIELLKKKRHARLKVEWESSRFASSSFPKRKESYHVVDCD